MATRHVIALAVSIMMVSTLSGYYICTHLREDGAKGQHDHQRRAVRV